MKTIYVKPTVAETIISMDNVILANSITWDDEQDTGSGELIEEDATGKGMSRRRDLWEDEEEEENY